MTKIVLLIAVVWLLSGSPIHAITNGTERDALVALYNGTGGTYWLRADNWGEGDPCDQNWYGVHCTDGHVTALVLSGNQLNGPVPAELGTLSSLSELSLPFNGLSGRIPHELGELVELRGLELANNQLNGPIPAALSDLSHLRLLVLSANPALHCWETEQAREWATGIESYYGTRALCRFMYLPGLADGVSGRLGGDRLQASFGQ